MFLVCINCALWESVTNQHAHRLLLGNTHLPAAASMWTHCISVAVWYILVTCVGSGVAHFHQLLARTMSDLCFSYFSCSVLKYLFFTQDVVASLSVSQYMWSVQKVSELFYYNFSGHACNWASLIAFIVLPSCIDALLSVPLPLLETVLVCLFRDRTWLHLRIFRNILNHLKSSSFQSGFQFGK
jgi:hypothetical protein